MNTPADTALITTAEELETLLLSLANKDKAAHLSRYFKTGKADTAKVTSSSASPSHSSAPSHAALGRCP